MTISGLVLAAGASSRMGRPKQLLPYGSDTMLGGVLAAARASVVDEVVVVTGFDAAAVEAGLPDDIRVVRNPDPARGNPSSLLVGLEACAGSEAVVLLLADQPGIDASVVDALVAAWRDSDAWAAVTSYRGRPGHPFLLPPDLADDVELSGDRPLWRILVDDPLRPVLHVTVDHDPPRDVDTPEDYRRLVGDDPLPPGSRPT